MLDSDGSHSASQNQASSCNEIRDVLRSELLIVVAKQIDQQLVSNMDKELEAAKPRRSLI